VRRRLATLAGLAVALASCSNPPVDTPASVTVPTLPPTSAVIAPTTTAVVVETTASGSDGYEAG
jgi:hypothetical protein